MSPRYQVSASEIPGWVYARNRIEVVTGEQLYLCSGYLGIAIDGAEKIPADDERRIGANARSITALFSADRSLPPAEIGIAFLRQDHRLIDAAGDNADDFAIQIGNLYFDLRFVAIVRDLFPGCAWHVRIENERDPAGYALAKLADRPVAVVMSFRGSDVARTVARAS